MTADRLEAGYVTRCPSDPSAVTAASKAALQGECYSASRGTVGLVCPPAHHGRGDGWRIFDILRSDARI
jgi:hypothetical protein